MNSSLSALKSPWHMPHHQFTDFSHSSVFRFADHNSKKSLAYTMSPKSKKRGDPAGSPPVAGLTGFCNAITVFILLNFEPHVKQFLQPL